MKPPKIVKAVIDDFNAEVPSVTKGKEYPVVSIWAQENKKHGFGFNIINDIGQTLDCLEKQCSHQSGKNWIIVKRES